MPTKIVWEGHNIEISTRLSPKFLFFATETNVKVDGKEVARCGAITFTESAVGSFDHNGKNVQIEVEIRSGLFSFSSFDYLARINGLVVSQGKAGIENIAIGCLLWFAVVALAGYFIC